MHDGYSIGSCYNEQNKEDFLKHNGCLVNSLASNKYNTRTFGTLMSSYIIISLEVTASLRVLCIIIVTLGTTVLHLIIYMQN